MQGVTILDKDPETRVLNFDLHDILLLFGNEVEGLQWDLRNVECTGKAAEILHSASTNQVRLSGGELLKLTNQILQVIDGEFTGYSPNSELPLIEIHAVDSSAFDVYSSNKEILGKIRKRFRQVEEIPKQ